MSLVERIIYVIKVVCLCVKVTSQGAFVHLFGISWKERLSEILSAQGIPCLLGDCIN